ncbi:hypothetical protein ACFQFQ_16870 [Sulfitobacter porphyrae]|uniref:DUF2019 domain-containing protein n=1 Tax=Sulfitobacter porphyrae TaxID=1246864 RepID=A0ABW2B5X4_9RHOB|nr:hypothetical protein GCM10007928_06210 [Sulfitobacter porphyrae]
MKDDLLVRYRNAAYEHSIASADGRYKVANKAYDEIQSILEEISLSNRDDELFELYEDAEPGVQLWAATHTLEIDSLRAEQKIKELVNDPSIIGLSAQMTLRGWRAGKIRFRDSKH